MHAGSGKSTVCHDSQRINSDFQQILQKGANHVKGQIKHRHHDADKTGNRRIFSSQDPIHSLTSDALFALLWLNHCLFTNLLYKSKTHIRNGCAAVKSPLAFHLRNNMFQHFLFVGIQLKLFQNQMIPLDQLCGRKAYRNLSHLGMILNQVADSMDTAVNRSSKIIFITEVLTARMFLILGDMYCVSHQLVNPLVFGR